MRIKMRRRNTMLERLVPASAVVLLFTDLLRLEAWLPTIILAVGAAAKARGCSSAAHGKRLACLWGGFGTSAVSGGHGQS